MAGSPHGRAGLHTRDSLSRWHCGTDGHTEETPTDNSAPGRRSHWHSRTGTWLFFSKNRLAQSSSLCAPKVRYTPPGVPGGETATLLFPHLTSPRTQRVPLSTSALHGPGTAAELPSLPGGTARNRTHLQSPHSQSPGPGQCPLIPQPLQQWGSSAAAGQC